MHYNQNEKYEIIKLVEQSDLGVIRTLNQLNINKTGVIYSTYYNHFIKKKRINLCFTFEKKMYCHSL